MQKEIETPEGHKPSAYQEYRALQKLRWLHDIYMILQLLLLLLALYGFYWSATDGPLREYVHQSTGNLIVFIILVVFTPFLLKKAFPLSYTASESKKTPTQALAGERIKVALLWVVFGFSCNELIFAVHSDPVQHIVGYFFTGVTLLVAGFLLRNEQKGVLWNFWHSFYGVKTRRPRWRDFITWPSRQRLFRRKENPRPVLVETKKKPE